MSVSVYVYLCLDLYLYLYRYVYLYVPISISSYLYLFSIYTSIQSSFSLRQTSPNISHPPRQEDPPLRPWDPPGPGFRACRQVHAPRIQSASSPPKKKSPIGSIQYRLQKVGRWGWDDLCWFAFLSRLWGWRTVIFQLFGLYCFWFLFYTRNRNSCLGNVSRILVLGPLGIGLVLWRAPSQTLKPLSPPVKIIWDLFRGYAEWVQVPI